MSNDYAFLSAEAGYLTPPEDRPRGRRCHGCDDSCPECPLGFYGDDDGDDE